MKRALLAVIGQCLAVAVIGTSVAAVANAQNSASAGVGVSGAASVASPTPISATMPVDSGFLQFNNLTVESVSAANPPAEILATNPNIYTIMGGSGAEGMMVPPVAPGTPSASTGVCYKYESENSAAGKAVRCPLPPTTDTSTGSGTAAPMIYPAPPFRYQPYRIKVDASTKLYLRDRTVASLSSFTAGDQINVFGYYNADGSIQAYLIRDLSKPVQSEFLQLNSVELVTIATNTTPNTLVVIQQSGYPCYGFGTNGANRESIVCPMGVQAAPGSGVLKNMEVPTAMIPSWDVAKKYVINLDAQTVLLDSNRTRLGLADLEIGDSLNIYGDTNDNGQTLNADIVRDLSIPAVAQSYGGTVTQVNTDGSFMLKLGDGRTITVKSPIQVGATLQLTGILDRLQNILSQVSAIYDAAPAMSVTPVGILRAKGGVPPPSNPDGTPNTQN